MPGAPPPLPRRSSSALPAIIAILLIVGVTTAGLMAAFLAWQTGVLGRKAPAPTAETATPPAPEQRVPPEPPPVEAATESTPVPVAAPAPTSRQTEPSESPTRREPIQRTGIPPLLQPRHTAPIRPGGDIKAPAKIRNVTPVYPPIAVSARVQGIVIIEATIGQTGKVEETRVLRSIPLLDQAALDAVQQWEYEPTLRNGTPVKVIMTVTVNFTLR